MNDIVVCGHSQCGAMDALMRSASSPQSTPHLDAWLELAAPVREIVRREYPFLKTEYERQSAAAEENVLFALENLRTYPCVQRRLAESSLRLHGWYFKIATAELFAFDPSAQQFKPLVKEEPPAR